MTRVLSVVNQRCGAGKTTTAINLGYALTRAGKRTLVVDLDPRCIATTRLGYPPAPRHPFMLDGPLSDNVHQVDSAMDLVPGYRGAYDEEQVATADHQSGASLQSRLSASWNPYDFVMLDCPPSLDHLFTAGLSASTEVLVPVRCEYFDFAMDGLKDMIPMIGTIMRDRTSQLEIGGILLTMVDDTVETTDQIDAQVRDFFGDFVFHTVIPRDTAIGKADNEQQSVIDYAPRSRATRAYLELCMEVLGR